MRLVAFNEQKMLNRNKLLLSKIDDNYTGHSAIIIVWHLNLKRTKLN